VGIQAQPPLPVGASPFDLLGLGGYESSDDSATEGIKAPAEKFDFCKGAAIRAPAGDADPPAVAPGGLPFEI